MQSSASFTHPFGSIREELASWLEMDEFAVLRCVVLTWLLRIAVCVDLTLALGGTDVKVRTVVVVAIALTAMS